MAGSAAGSESARGDTETCPEVPFAHAPDSGTESAAALPAVEPTAGAMTRLTAVGPTAGARTRGTAAGSGIGSGMLAGIAAGVADCVAACEAAGAVAAAADGMAAEAVTLSPDRTGRAH